MFEYEHSSLAKLLMEGPIWLGAELKFRFFSDFSGCLLCTFSCRCLGRYLCCDGVCVFRLCFFLNVCVSVLIAVTECLKRTTWKQERFVSQIWLTVSEISVCYCGEGPVEHKFTSFLPGSRQRTGDSRVRDSHLVLLICRAWH